MTTSFFSTKLQQAYSVGALLYTPANRNTIASAVCQQQFGTRYSLALCLEDTINDIYLPQAEQQAVQTLQQISLAQEQQNFYLPQIYIRLRAPEQLSRLLAQLGSARSVLTGFIFPKFSLENASAYLEALTKANSQQQDKKFYMMPVLEDRSLLALSSRSIQLERLKALLDQEPQVLNIRVGCNDLCNLFGLRRHPQQTIYQVLPVAQILSDILTVFQQDYVVSAPVWEYFQDQQEQWKAGLEQELALDLLNGFTGKTVIHPKQIAIVNAAMQVSPTDYEDACQILNWDQNNPFYVSGSVQAQRMNEYKTHHNWAQRTLLLAQLYGVGTA